jgi:hypothetical protein
MAFRRTESEPLVQCLYQTVIVCDLLVSEVPQA